MRRINSRADCGVQPPSLKAQFIQAETAFGLGQWWDALAGYVGVARGEPRFSKARFRAADTLLNLGYQDEAKRIYRALAWDHIRGGRPLLGLVATKMVLALNPQLEDILAVLAELYSADSDRTGDLGVPSLVTLSSSLPAISVDEGGDALVRAALRIGVEPIESEAMPQMLPRIPLFTHLREAAFLEVLQSLMLRRYAHGEELLREGDPGDSFFILVDGEVSIWRGRGSHTALLARLSRGAVFGEMSLVSRSARTATVRAIGEVDALELSRSDLEGHAGQLESVKDALRKFTRSRLLANLAATSPLFGHLPFQDRRGLMRMFRAQRVFPGDILIEKGEKARGLYLVLSGEMKVLINNPLGSETLAVLNSGEVFGEMSLLHDELTSASVVVKDVGEVLFLPADEFREVIRRYPAVLDTLMSMSSERLARRRLVETGDVLTDDASILV